MEEKFVGIRFAENDWEMKQAVKEYFQDCVIIRSDELEGTDVVLVAIIPLAGFALQLIDFILNHMVKKETSVDDKNANESTAHRAIVSDGKTVCSGELVGVNEKQLKKTLSMKLNLNFEFKVEK